MFKKLILIIVGVIIIHGIISAVLFNKKDSVKEVACTMEAKICPDGSSVGRSGPDCQFSECPTLLTSSSNVSVIKTDIGLLQGQVTLSPTCPVEHIPPDPNCLAKPLATLVDVFSNSNSKFSIEVHADKDGKFFMHLPVGTYKVFPHINALYPICPSNDVTIEAHSTTTLNILCDTGIR